MEAALKPQKDWNSGIMGRPLIDPEWKSKPKYSEDEFWNMAYADLGKRYGLKDIRESAK